MSTHKLSAPVDQWATATGGRRIADLEPLSGSYRSDSTFVLVRLDCTHMLYNETS